MSKPEVTHIQKVNLSITSNKINFSFCRGICVNALPFSAILFCCESFPLRSPMQIWSVLFFCLWPFTISVYYFLYRSWAEDRRYSEGWWTCNSFPLKRRWPFRFYSLPARQCTTTNGTGKTAPEKPSQSPACELILTFLFFSYLVCFWCPRPAAKRHSMQPGAAGTLHYLPKSYGPPRGPQCHVCSQSAKSTEDRRHPLC